MKRIFLLSIILLCSINVFPQWWTHGGNLIWPYGNVDITKGNLTLDKGDLSLNTGDLYLYDGLIDLESGGIYAGDGVSAPYMSADDSVSAPYLSADSSNFNGPVSSNHVKDKAGLIEALSLDLDVPNTYLDYTVYRNDFGGTIDTVVFDNTTHRVNILWKGNYGTALNQYETYPSRMVVLVNTSGGYKAALTGISLVHNSTLGMYGLAVSFYDINSMSVISDITSVSIDFFTILIPDNDTDIGYHHEEYGL